MITSFIVAIQSNHTKIISQKIKQTCSYVRLLLTVRLSRGEKLHNPTSQRKRGKRKTRKDKIRGREEKKGKIGSKEQEKEGKTGGGGGGRKKRRGKIRERWKENKKKKGRGKRGKEKKGERKKKTTTKRII